MMKPHPAPQRWLTLRGGKSSCEQCCIANLRADVSHSLKWCVEDERTEGRPPSSLTLPTEKAESVPFLSFSSSAHITALLETLKWLPFALRKTIQIPSRDWQGAPCSGPCFSSSLIFHGSSPLHSALATGPNFGSVSRFSSFPLPCLCLCHIFMCWLQPISQASVRKPAAQSSARPSTTILCGNLPVATYVLLWFQCPSLFHLYISKMIVYSLADCLIGI